MGCSNSPSVNNDNCMVNGYVINTPNYPYTTNNYYPNVINNPNNVYRTNVNNNYPNTNQGNNNYSNAIIKEQEKRKDSIFETDSFEEEDYPFFQDNYYEKYIKNIRKDFLEYMDDDDGIYYNHHRIYITINYKENITTITEIDISDKIDMTRHLKKQILYDCPYEKVKPYIEKYNSIFMIDTNLWEKQKATTDIYVKAENENGLKKLEMFYEKDISFLKFYKINNNGSFSSGTSSLINPKGVVDKYNSLKEDFTVFRRPEIFHYVDKPKNNSVPRNNSSYVKNSSYDNNYNNNDNEPKNEKKRRSASMRDGSGNYNGRVESDGDIKDGSGNIIGKFESDGDIKDGSGNIIGRIENDGDVRNGSGNIIGRIESDGDIKDGSGNIIGRIENDGDIRDGSGNIIGKAEGMDREKAAFLYFFK